MPLGKRRSTYNAGMSAIKIVRDNSAHRGSGCVNPNGFCATFIGPLFDQSPRKMLFIGLDSGREGNGCIDALEWQKRVMEVHHDEGQKWNWHYKASIFLEAGVLGLNQCKYECREACSGRDLSLCALAHMAQGNAVKCVAAGNITMDFQPNQRGLIPSCLPMTFEEAALIKPDVIVTQGSGVEDRLYDLMRQRGTVNSDWLTTEEAMRAGTMSWSNNDKKTLLITSKAPAAFRYEGSWNKFIEEHIEPILLIIQNWLRRASEAQVLRSC